MGIITANIFSVGVLLGIAFGISIVQIVEGTIELIRKKKRKEFLKKLNTSDYRLCQEFFDEVH